MRKTPKAVACAAEEEGNAMDVRWDYEALVPCKTRLTRDALTGPRFRVNIGKENSPPAVAYNRKLQQPYHGDYKSTIYNLGTTIYRRP
jgi:hypothetical protein